MTEPLAPNSDAPRPSESSDAAHVASSPRSTGRETGLTLALRLIGAGPLVILLAIWIMFTIASPVFLTALNIGNLFAQSSVVAILALATLFVILIGELDLSVGTNMGLSTVIGAWTYSNYPELGWAIVPIMILAPALVGAVNAFLVVTLRIGNSFIITLGMLYVLLSISFVVGGGYSIRGMPPLVVSLGQDRVFGTPAPALVVAVCSAILWYILRQMVWGRWVFALGGSASAAEKAGIPVAKVRFGAFVVAGAFVGVAAILVAGRADAGFPDTGNSVLLAIASVVIGGTSLRGGRGGVVGTLIGALILASITNGLGLLSVDPNLVPLAVGVVLIAAVGIDAVRGRVETDLRLRRARAQA